ncbi:MAG: VCBS repeat-containing protein [Myxococcota bacterium]
MSRRLRLGGGTWAVILVGILGGLACTTTGESPEVPDASTLPDAGVLPPHVAVQSIGSDVREVVPGQKRVRVHVQVVGHSLPDPGANVTLTFLDDDGEDVGSAFLVDTGDGPMNAEQVGWLFFVDVLDPPVGSVKIRPRVTAGDLLADTRFTTWTWQVLPPPTVSDVTLAGAGGCASVRYTLSHPDSRRVDVEVIYAVNGGEPVPVTAAPGGEGLRGLPTSPTGTSHVFPWDWPRDLPTYQSAEVVVRAGLQGVFTSEARATVTLDPRRAVWADAVHLPVAEGISSVALGHLDRDGILDVAATSHTNDEVKVLLGTGGGNLGSPSTHAAGLGPESVLVVDINHDGAEDLVVPNHDTNSVSVLAGDGTGALAPAVDHAVATNPYAVAVADLDGDGRLDIVTANEVGESVSVLLARADGGYDAVDYPMGSSPHDVKLADFNRDGLLDVITTNWSGDNLSLRLGVAGGTFSDATSIPTNVFPESVTVADVTGDGMLDLLVATYLDVQLHPGVGDGTFLTAQALNAALGPRDIAVGAVDDDGILDLVVANERSANVSVLLGLGGGAFAEAFHLAAGPQPRALALGDLDDDGRLDILVANYGDGTLSVLMHRGARECARSFESRTDHGSAAVDVDVVDLNADGHLDVVSVGAARVQLMWGQGAGIVGEPTSFEFGGGNVVEADVGDVTGDGVADLVVAGTDALLMLRGQPNGFGTTETVAASGFLTVDLTDIDGDGRDDVVGVNALEQDLRVFLATDSGFTPLDVFHRGLTGPVDVETGDFDLNGTTDIAVAWGSNTVDVLENLGNGGLLSHAHRMTTFEAVESVTFGYLGERLRPSVVATGEGQRAFLVTWERRGWNDENIPLDGPALRAAIVDMDGTGGNDLLTLDGSAVARVYRTDTGFPLMYRQVGAQPRAVTVAGDALFVSGADGVSVARVGPEAPCLWNLPRAVNGLDVVGGELVFSLRDVSAVEIVPPTFPAPVEVNLPAPAADVVAADLEHDGKNDVLVATSDGIAVVRSAAAEVFADGLNAVALDTGDVDDDGDVDVVVGGATELAWLAGTGEGHLGEPTTLLAGTTCDVAVGDVDLDGLTDVVVSDGQSVRVILRNGPGTFDAPVTVYSQAGACGLAVADVDDDLFPEVVVANSAEASVNVVAGLGTPSVTRVAVGRNPGEPIIADVDGNGRNDVVVANRDERSVSVLYGPAPWRHVRLGMTSPVGVAVLDVDPDGKPDVILADTDQCLRLIRAR